MEKVLFDTDIGTDIDDALALAYLLCQPECDLLGVGERRMQKGGQKSSHLSRVF